MAHAWGHHLYVDDLSTAPEGRRQGHAGALLDWLIEEGRRLGCSQLHLDSGVGAERFDAHRALPQPRPGDLLTPLRPPAVACVSGGQQLDAVAPRILRVEPPDIYQRVIPAHLLASLPQTLGQRVKLSGCHAERRVGLARRRKRLLDTHMQLLIPAGKPHPATLTQRLGLLDLHQAEELPIEPPRLGLTASWSGYLHVIETHDTHRVAKLAAFAAPRTSALQITSHSCLAHQPPREEHSPGAQQNGERQRRPQGCSAFRVGDKDSGSRCARDEHEHDAHPEAGNHLSVSHVHAKDTLRRMPNINDPVRVAHRSGDGFRVRRARVGHQLGTERLGVSIWEVPPRQAAYPYHYHLAEEELVVVLEGTPSLRDLEGWRELEEGEVCSFPRGERGAHQLMNRSASTVRLLALSTHGEPDIVLYPDSGKLGAAERLPSGGGLRKFFRLSDDVDYYDGEQPPG